MRFLAVIVVLCVATATLAAEAQAEGPWYVSGSAGAYFRESAAARETITNGIITAPGTLAASFDPGVIANLAVGYRLPLRLRVEAEIGYAQYSVDKVNPQSSAFPTLNGSDFHRQSGSDLRRYMGTLNLFYDVPLEGRFVPYAGVGLGGVQDKGATIRFVNASGASFRQTFGSGAHGVFLIEGGITIAVSDALSIVPAYRYLHYFANTGTNGDEVAHIAKVGVRYSF